jgi:hypothetical protein
MQHGCVFKPSGVSGWQEGCKSELADELEALGRAFEQEAREVEESLLRRSVQQSTRVSQHYEEAGEMAEAV